MDVSLMLYYPPLKKYYIRLYAFQVGLYPCIEGY